MTNRKQKILLGLAAIITLAPLPALARNPFEFPTPVTPVARETLEVHDLFLVIITIIFTIGIMVLFYSLVTHRKSRGHKPAAFTGPRGAKQWALTILPFLMLTFIDYVVMGIPAYHAVLAMANTRDDAQLVIKITGSQWKWQYEYLDQGIRFTSRLATPPEELDGRSPKGANYLLDVDKPLVLPVGQKVRILLASADVIHSWGMPAFGVKQDAVPGFLRESWVKIEQPGVYRGQCGELCGIGHAYMPIVVVAKAPAEFQQWVAQAQADQAGAAAESSKVLGKDELLVLGKKVYEANCAVCHQANGLGVPGTFPPIAAGQPFSAAPALLAGLTAHGFYKDGRIDLGPVKDHIEIVLYGIAGSSMPAFGAQLSDADIAAAVTYERNTFGNQSGDVIQPADVKTARAGK